MQRVQQENPLDSPLIADQQHKDLTQKNQEKSPFSKEYQAKQYFLFSTNFFQAIVFSWISPLLKYGSSNHLSEKTVPILRPQHKPKIDFNRLYSSFNSTKKSKIEGWTLAKGILKAFKKQFLLILSFSLLKTALQMYSPILSHNVISYISQGERSTEESLIYFFGIFGVTLFLALVTSYLFFYFGVLGFNLSNILSLLVFNKALKHPLISEKKFTAPDLINYSQIDAQRMTYMGFQMVALFFTPIQILIGLYLLYAFIGTAFVVGTGVMLILMLFTLFFSKLASKYNDKLLASKDERMKGTQQMLQIIKFVKINALQKYFFKKINNKRQVELGFIKNVNLCYVINIFVFWVCPPLIVSATFLLYIYQGNEITAAKAFITIIIFNILHYPMRLFPTSISAFLQIWSSLKRIEKFLLSEQINRNFIENNDYRGQQNAIQIQHGYFLWGKQKQQTKNEQPLNKAQNDLTSTNDKSSGNINNDDEEENLSEASSIYIDRKSLLLEQKKNDEIKNQSRYIKALQNINLKIPAKKITMIIGDIGSGKTSLLFSILNQMTAEPMRNPIVKVNGEIAYAPQKPWMMSGTVKQNILFFNPFDPKKLKQVIHYSCLGDDIKLFVNGIETEIGEKGVNLSGGQKARISLARTLYANRDIYFLDDILSAVDVHVGKFIMEKTIMGFLKEKTIVMPTHAVKYLESADNVIVMKRGKIVAQGPLSFVKSSQQFQSIMMHQQKKSFGEEDKQEQKAIITNQKVQKQTIRSFAKKSFNLKRLSFGQPKADEPEKQNIGVEAVEKAVEQLIMPEDQKVGKVSKQIYLKYIKQNGGLFFVFPVLFCLSVWTALSTLSNIQIKIWCSDENKDVIHLYLYLVFSVIGTLFTGLQSYIVVASALRQSRSTHKQIMKSLLYTSLTKFYHRIPMGRILNRLSKDLRQLDETIGNTVSGTLVNIFYLGANLIMCVYGSTLWMLIPIAVATFGCIKIKNYYLKTQRQCVRLQNITNSPIVSGFTSAINGLGTIRAYGLEQQFLNHQTTKIQTNKRMRVSRSAMESWFALRLTFLSFIINMSAIGYCLLEGNKSAAIIGLLLTYTSVLGDDIINVAFSYANLELKMISVERIGTFTEIEPESGYSEYCKDWRTKEQGANFNAIPQGSIQFKGYSSRYREDLPLCINNITLKIEPGDKVGIVGRTGAGKSTLINCLLRILEPSNGKVLIDGKDIMEYNLKDLRACLTMIEQQPTLMNGTFRDNLDPTKIYSDKQILAVLQECNLLEMVNSKGGLDSKVSNQNLSVGEKQLLCICRAFLKKSKIILVDEATANIDVKNDHLIQEVISQKFKDSTVLTIAHRLTTLKDCNKILVLGSGKVLEWGSSIQLLGTDSIYRKMCQSNDKSYFD